MSSSADSVTTTTSNDEAIARALARQEQEVADAELARRMMQSSSSTSPFSASASVPSSASLPPPAGASFRPGGPPIIQGRPVPPPPHHHQPRQQHHQHQQQSRQRHEPPPPSQPFTASLPFPGAASLLADDRPHMCIAPCVIHGDTVHTTGAAAASAAANTNNTKSNGGICVEMMVDTGAQTSVISLQLARQLGLEGRIDRRQQGVAAGVGRARIVGKIRSVVCELHLTEFVMDFSVLDVPDHLLLLGLDLMRRYKCIVDLERDVLIFGGAGGVEVPLLPAEEQHLDRLRQHLGCPLM